MNKSIKNKQWVGVASLILMLVSITLYGCDDFLNTPAKGDLNQSTLANVDGVEGTLVGAYRMLGGWSSGLGASWGAASSNWVLGSVASDDASKGSTPSDQLVLNDIELYNWGSASTEQVLDDKWKSVYEGVVRSNATLRLLNDVLEANPSGISEDQTNAIRGEALFLRAHYHFESWKVWKNIPYFFENDEVNIKSNQGVPVIENIISDLQEAISLLPETPRNGAVGRVTSWTAKAYLGRVQIYTGDYSSALTTLRDVRDNGPYALEENYYHVWTGFTDLQNGPETILAYQASASDGDPNGNNANYGDRLNFPADGSSPFSCCGFHQPTRNLVNFFAVNEAGLPLALNDTGWNDRDEPFEGGDTDRPVDPRLDWTVGRNYVPYYDWGAHEPEWTRGPEHGGPYTPKKNVHTNASGAQGTTGWTPQQTNAVNIHLYRYADLLLLLAEAEVEEGSLENARAIVNQIRERASVVAQGPGDNAETIAVPIDDPSITWADYEIGLYTEPWTNKEFARTAVRYERRLELAMEGHRLFDLRRWGIAREVLNNFIETESPRYPFLDNALEFDERHANYYPIPQIQIDISSDQGEGTLIQNDGW